eukprot:m.270875 g.270875  ORF g.270875 m.270875 type:complete len:119 (+) comp91985_c0_seq1:19-375(+)
MTFKFGLLSLYSAVRCDAIYVMATVWGSDGTELDGCICMWCRVVGEWDGDVVIWCGVMRYDVKSVVRCVVYVMWCALTGWNHHNTGSMVVSKDGVCAHFEHDDATECLGTNTMRWTTM